MNSISDLTPQQLRQAADLQEKIQRLQHELDQLLGSPAAPASPRAARGGRRQLSAAGLANIRAAQQRRWAKVHASAGNGKAAKQPKRKMSAAAKAAISARMKERWAAAKKSGKNAL